MKELLNKEIKLASSPLSYLFILFSLMALIPGYPILVGAFFICFGVFHSFQQARENNDILYTILLPVKKADAVKAKYIFTVFIQMVAWIVSLGFVILRMTALKNGIPYVNNVMMNANQIYLSWMLLIFASFNLVFIRGFFKTAYKFTKPFIAFIIVAFVMIGIAEVLHHIPGLEVLNSNDCMGNGVFWLIMVICLLVYASVTCLACKSAKKVFEKVDM